MPITDPNNAGYIGERYGRILASQTTKYFRADVTVPRKLNGFRKIHNYIGEEPATVGYGVNSLGTRAFFFDTYADADREMRDNIIIDAALFNSKGVLKSHKEATVAVINGHAVARMYERLRTNSLEDVMPWMTAMLMLPRDIGAWFQTTLRGKLGELRCERVLFVNERLGREYPVWVAKTFIPARKGMQ